MDLTTGCNNWAYRVRQADRAHRGIRVLEEAKRAFQSVTNRLRMSESDCLFDLTEALGLHDMYLAFHRHPPQQLRERLTER